VLLFNVTGTLGTQVVTADQTGNWSAKFIQEPPVLGTTLTITAVAVDGDGRALSSVTIVTTTLE
jgi:hypothetical protein